MRAIWLLPCSWLLAACSGAGDAPESGAGAFAAVHFDGVRLNEVHFAADPVASEPWLELINTGTEAAKLSNYIVITDQVRWALPDTEVPAGSVLAVRGLVSSNDPGRRFLEGPLDEIRLVTVAGEEVDSAHVAMTSAGESLARYPNGTGDFYVYPEASVTLEKMNPDLGFVHKLASSAAFSPRDSSPNAIVRFQGSYWILGGWRNFGGEDWHSSTDVWRSEDGTDWELINPSPPYVHYCSFVVWNDRIWAIGPSSFSSADGVTWRPEAVSVPELNRSVVFGDQVVTIAGSTVIASSDGQSWRTLTHAAPWGAAREKMSVIVYRGRIWVIGGVTGYGTAEQLLYNDVWSSSDGVTWDLVTASAPWTPRVWASVAVHDDRIFLLNGSNLDYYADGFGNSAEIWFTEDGASWVNLKAERLWQERHASFVVADEARQGLLLLAGYSGGGLPGIRNDAWLMQARAYFPKPDGPLHELGTWGRNMDGTGSAPPSFTADNAVFVLRNRSSFDMDERWSIAGAGSRIVVGDGDRSRPVVVYAKASTRPSGQPVYLNSNSTLVVEGSPPDILLQDPSARILRP